MGRKKLIKEKKKAIKDINRQILELLNSRDEFCNIKREMIVRLEEEKIKIVSQPIPPKFKKNGVIIVDENDTEGILSFLNELHPSELFIEKPSNISITHDITIKYN